MGKFEGSHNMFPPDESSNGNNSFSPPNNSNAFGRACLTGDSSTFHSSQPSQPNSSAYRCPAVQRDAVQPCRCELPAVPERRPRRSPVPGRCARQYRPKMETVPNELPPAKVVAAFSGTDLCQMDLSLLLTDNRFNPRCQHSARAAPSATEQQHINS